MRPEADRMDLLELVLHGGVGEFLEGEGVHERLAVRHEGQFEGLADREAAGRVARQGPDEVDDAVAGLVEELRRRAAELHRRKDVDLDAAVRILAHLLRPGRQELRLAVGDGREEVVHAQRHLRRLRVTLAQKRRGGDGAPGKGQEAAAGRGHGGPPRDRVRSCFGPGGRVGRYRVRRRLPPQYGGSASPRLRGEGSAFGRTSGAKRSGGEGASPEQAPVRAAAPSSSPPPHPRLLRRLAASGSPLPAGRGVRRSAICSKRNSHDG